MSEYEGLSDERRLKLESLRDRYHLSNGPAETVAGEILRALIFIERRFHNDGDRIGLESGGCGNSHTRAAFYLKRQFRSKHADVCKIIDEMLVYKKTMFGHEYGEKLNALIDLIINILKLDLHYETTRNKYNFFTYGIKGK